MSLALSSMITSCSLAMKSSAGRPEQSNPANARKEPSLAALDADRSRSGERRAAELLKQAVDAIELLQVQAQSLQAEAARALARCASSEAHIAELEARIAEGELVEVDLRSRLVCVYGKLAAASDTVRYNSLARTLAERRSNQDPSGHSGNMPDFRGCLS
jgi:FtsZ-binding cell division protein ZapB